MSSKTVPTLTPEDLESRKPLLLAVEITTFIITLFAVGLRTYSRIVVSRSFGADDQIIVISTIIAFALTIINCEATRFGLGLHTAVFQLQWYVPSRKLALSTEVLFIVCACFTKLSILTFYMRLIVTGRFRIFAYIGFALVGALGLGFFVVALTRCRPMQRIGLVALFSLGFIVCVAGSLRIWWIYMVLKVGGDITWDGAILYTITAIELNVGILCASIPAIKPLFAQLFPRLLGSTGNSESLPSYQLNHYSGGGDSSYQNRKTGVATEASAHQNESEECIVNVPPEGINKTVDISMR
ncbi:hypothetical protein RUND412_006353 [Rhizina undulata]